MADMPKTFASRTRRCFVICKPAWLAMSALLAACTGGETPPPPAALPTSGLYATFGVDTESFRASITNPEGMAEARALWAGTSDATIPTGLLICTGTAWNSPHPWHLDPPSVRFAEVTIEVCDARPSYLDANCDKFGTQYCPWGAELVLLQECTPSGCSEVPR